MERTAINKWLVTVTVMLPTFIEVLDTFVVNVALDHIRGSLSAGLDESTWAITSYLVANAIIIPMSDYICGFFGRKRTLIFSIGLFTLSSLACGLSWNLESLVFFRVLQGLGGGSLQPLSQAILLETFPPRQHGTAMAVFGTGILFAPVAGPVVGGWITDTWSWHWIFFINVPLGVLSIFMILPVIQDPPYMKRQSVQIDAWGLAFLAVGLGSLQVALDRGQGKDWFASPFICTLSIIALISLALFVFVELYARHPVVKLEVFKKASFSLGCIVTFFSGFSVFSSIVLPPIFVQNLMGYTALLSGLVLAPGGVATMFAMPLAVFLMTRLGSKAVCALGILTCVYGVALMSRFNLDMDFSAVVWPRIVIGVGMGLLFVPLSTLCYVGIRKEDMGNATALWNLVRNISSSIGVAFCMTMLARGSQIHQNYLVDHLTPFHYSCRAFLQSAQQALSRYGICEGGGQILYGKLLRESMMLSLNDTYLLLAGLMICVLPLVFFMKKGPVDVPPGMH